MVGLVIDGLREHASQALPAEAELQALLATDDGGVPLEPYREMLTGVLARGGGESLLRAGRRLDDLADPLLFVLLNSQRVRVLIEKEARLGRFIHSRHVVRIVGEEDEGITLEHLSRHDAPPQRGEDLAAAGQHIALLEQVGCQGLWLRLPRSADPQLKVYQDGVYREPAAGDCSLWAFGWQRFVPTRRPMPGLDEHLLAADPRPELDEVSALTSAINDVARRDLGRTWSLAEVAVRLETSPRSLQRGLAREGTRFSDVLERLRVQEAQRLLRTTALTVTEIGYVCGFADTSHFSRRFKRRVGCSPSRYRGGS